jgi:hypothetical protein
LRFAVLHVLGALAGDFAEEEFVEMPVVDCEVGSALVELVS